MGGEKNWSLGWARCLLVTLSLIYPSLSGMCLSLPVRAYFLHLNNFLPNFLRCKGYWYTLTQKLAIPDDFSSLKPFLSRTHQISGHLSSRSALWHMKLDNSISRPFWLLKCCFLKSMNKKGAIALASNGLNYKTDMAS